MDVETVVRERETKIKAPGAVGSDTALHLAAKNKHVAVVQALICADATVDEQNASGWTALHIASKNGDAPMIAALLKGHARVDIVTNKPKIIKTTDSLGDDAEGGIGREYPLSGHHAHRRVPPKGRVRPRGVPTSPR